MTSNGTVRPRILFFHSEVRPYRIPLFQMLHEQYDVRFIFLQGTREADRMPSMADLRYIYLKRIWFPGYSSDVCPGVASLLVGQRGTYDVAIFTGIFSFATHIGVPIAKLLGKKVTLWDESWIYPAHPLARAFTPFLRWLVRQADALVAAGSRTEIFYRSLGANEQKIFIAPNAAEDLTSAIDAAEAARLRRDLRIPNDGTIIGYLGRIVRYKNLDVLLRAFAQVRSDFPQAHLLIVGDGPFAPECKALLSDLGDERVHWISGQSKTLEPVNHRTFIHYLSLCDVFVLPGRFIMEEMVPAEAWGLTINEAMSLGKPIITSEAVAAAYDMVESGRNGYRVKPNNIEALIVALRTLLRDGRRRQQFGQRSRIMIEERFRYAHMTEGFTRAIKRVWSNR